MWFKSSFTTPAVAAISFCLIGGTTPAYADLGDQLFKLLADDGAAGDVFGFSVAISGDTAIVGALNDADNGNDSGSVYLFDSATGEQLSKLLASDGAEDDQFGFSVAINATTAIVGAWADDDKGDESGSAYLFDISDPENPVQIAKLLADDGTFQVWFGISVAIGGAPGSEIAIVGASRHRDNGFNSGSAYLFDTTTGQQMAKLLPSDGAAEEWFGGSVAIGGATGNEIAIVGARFGGDNGDRTGSAYLFDISDPTNPVQIAKLLADDGAFLDRFGLSVAITGATGNEVAIVGAWAHDDNGVWSGSAYLFDTTTGLQIAKLLPDDGAAHDSFGVSVAISGTTAIVSATGDDDNGDKSGSAYLFDISDPANPVQIAKLLTDDGAEDDTFGRPVAISGATAIFGARGDDDNGDFSGSAYLFELSSVDSDGDGLSDDDEEALGTDPNNPDTDGDGLLDGAEVVMAEGTGCPDPLNPDSDGDTLSDGAEVAVGTNPCNVDTDGDTLTDDVDSHPLDPEVSSGDLEYASRILCDIILGLDLSLFNGPNDNANAGRRNALANRCTNAANAIAINHIDEAIDELASLLAKIDDASPPPDWMDPSNEKTALADDVIVLIALLLLEL